MGTNRTGPADGLTFCSIVSKNYLAQARALAESVRGHHPAARQFVLLLDRPDGYYRPAGEPFTVVTLADLGLADAPRYCFQYTGLELSCAAKPWLMRHLFDKHAARKIVYLDGDILVLNNMRPLEQLLDRHAIVLTPHLTAPYADDKYPNDLGIVQAGTFNAGFVALSKGRAADQFLGWWAKRVDRDCLHKVEDGLNADQKWLDLVPGLFDGVHILRDPGYNVAYWNLHARTVGRHNGAVTVDGGPCYFFHYSGYDPAEPRTVSKFQNRFTFDGLGEAAAGVFDRYRDRLEAHGHPAVRRWPYTWAAFDNGVPVPGFVRRLYHQLGDAVTRFGDPFQAAGPDSFFGWLTAYSGGDVPPVLKAIYDLRPDLRAAFPDVTGANKDGFLGWALASAEGEYKLHPDLLARVRNPAPPPARCGRLLGGRFRPVSEPFGVNVLGFLRSEKGMGEACRATIRALTAAGVPHALNNWEDDGSANGDGSLSGFTTDNPYPVNVIHLNADAAPHLAREIPWYFRGRYNIGFWNWELDWFPEEWRGSFDHFDEVWAPSVFTRDSFVRMSPVPVTYVPYSIDVPPAAADAPTRDQLGLPRGTFAFLFAFDFHSLIARKNPLAVVEAFRTAFGDRRDVTLVLKPLRGDSAPLEYGEFLAACRGQANIRIFRDVLSRQGMYDLLRACDGYVALHRSEGFGLPLAEAMALGKPVVATNYSANVDFMTDSNSYPVRYKLVTIDRDHGPYRAGAEWADADVGHAAEQMRRVVDDPDRTALVAARGRDDIRRLLSPEVVGRTIRGRLTAILKGPLGDARPAARRTA